MIGEFERGQTVALTVRLGSAVYDYIRQLGDRLKENSYTGPLLVMQAYGGLLNADAATGKPVGMIESVRWLDWSAAEGSARSWVTAT